MSPRTRLALFATLATLLTSTALASVYVDSGWLWPTVGGVLAVLIGAEAGSRLGAHLLLPTLWRAVGALTGLALFSCARYAPDESWAGFVPTPSAVARLRELSDQAFDDINQLAAPVPSHTGLVFVTMAGVGLIAVLVDLLTVRAALTGLPLLALYSVPEWLSPHGTGALPFLLGAAGYLALLLHDGRERTTRWGRSIDAATVGPPELAPDTSAAGAIRQTGRRIGFAALGVALVVPPLVPTVDHAHLLGLGSGTGGGGSGPVVTYNPITKVYGYLHQGEATEQLRYAVASGAHPTYLQWTTLDRYSDSGWSQSDLKGAGRAKDGLPAPAVVTQGTHTVQYAMRISVADQLDLKWLPVPENTTAVEDISDQWVYDARSRTIFSPHSNTRGLSYGLTAVDPQPATSTLIDSGMLPRASAPEDVRPYYDLPRDTSPRVQRKAEALTKKYATPYQKALALQAYFTDPQKFVYDVDAGSGGGSDLLARFVLDERKGFCEQFASAMAVMARMIGIPARVAVGFTPGDRDARTGEYVVTSADAHAWPELYFDGVGWLRFEPTPRGDGQTRTPAYADARPGAVAPPQADPGTEDPGSAPGGPAPHRSGIPRNIDANGDLGFGTADTAPVTTPDKPISARMLALVAVLALLLLAFAAVPLSRLVGRRRRHLRAHDPVSRAHAAWRDVLTDAADLGWQVPPSDSPRGVARRLVQGAHLAPGAAEAMYRLASAEERARYAARLPEVGDLEGDAHLVRGHLMAAAGRWTRLRARLLPPSTVQAATEAVGARTGALLDGIDAATARLSAAVRRPLRRSGA